MILYQSGVDGLHSARRGHLSLTHKCLEVCDRKVMHAPRSHDIPLVVTLGGGYSIPVGLAAEPHANVYRGAWEVVGQRSRDCDAALESEPL